MADDVVSIIPDGTEPSPDGTESEPEFESPEETPLVRPPPEPEPKVSSTPEPPLRRSMRTRRAPERFTFDKKHGYWNTKRLA